MQRDSIVTVVRNRSDQPPESLALQNYAAEAQCESATTIPLCSQDGDVVGAVLCVDVASSASANESGEEQGLMQSLGLPIGTSLDAVQRRQPGVVRRFLRRTLRSRGSLGWLLMGTLVVVAGVLAIPSPYRIAAPFECEADSQQYCVAPFDGLLKTMLVKPGDLVAAGQPLALMDDRELVLELSELQARQQKADKEQESYLADENVAESYMSALESDRVGHRRELLMKRRSQLELRSEIDGVVLSGSQDRRENFPVKRGDPLLEVAPLASLLIEIAVPDDEIRHVTEGMAVEMRADSNATLLLEGTVERIRPRSETRDETNVFVVEVSIDNTDGHLRPGMRGDARIVSESHSLAWNLFHRAWEHTSMKLLW